MTAFVLTATPAVLLTLAIEMKEGRLAVLPDTLDGGIAIGIAAILARIGGMI
jgi:Flp pilus assembly protein TadB